MHLLPTVAASLDEQVEAVDLAQTPAEFVALSFTDTDLSALAAAWRRDRAVLPTMRLASLKRLKHPMSVDLYVESVIGGARAVLVRSLGGLDYWRYGFEEVARTARERGIDLYCLPGDDRPDHRLAALSTVPADVLQHVDQCLRLGGPGNVRSALFSIATRLGRSLVVDAPKPVPAAGESPSLSLPHVLAKPSSAWTVGGDAGAVTLAPPSPLWATAFTDLHCNLFLGGGAEA